MPKTINPEFQGAPYLGDSSYDPIKFVQQQNLAKYKIAKEEKDERESDNAQMLKSLLVDIKGWEDQKGFEELMADRQKVLDTFIGFSRKGMNLANPKTVEEHTMYKGISEALARVQQKAQAWNQQKGVYDFYMKQMETPGAEDKIDIEATKKNIEDVLSSNNILDRGTKLGNLIVKKPSIDAVNDFIQKNKSRLYQAPVRTSSYVDEQGITHTNTNPVEDSKEINKIEQSYKDLYATSDKTVQDGLKEVRRQNAEIDKERNFDTLSDAEYFAAMYDLPTRQKYSERLSKMGGGGIGISVNAFGRKMNITPGEQRDEPLPYGDKTFTNTYKFFSKDPLTINIGRNGSKMFTGDTWEEITDGGDVEANLLYYDAKDDVFIFRTTQTGNTPFVLNNATVTVPRAVLGKEADDLPIKTSDGKTKKLIEVFGPLKTVKKNPFGNDTTLTWEYKPYTTKGKDGKSSK